MKLIDFHTHNTLQRYDVISIVNQYPKEFDTKFRATSVGIHPWFIDTETLGDELAILEQIIKQGNCIAIGECGLDKKTETPWKIQQLVFNKQLELAEKYQIPVIIHCVSSFAATISSKNKLVSESVPLIIHGFAKKVEMAQQLIDHGFYLSFGSNLLKSKTLQNSFKNIRLDRVFLETGSHDQSIQEIYEFAAKLINISVHKLNEQITANFKVVFGSQKITLI